MVRVFFAALSIACSVRGEPSESSHFQKLPEAIFEFFIFYLKKTSLQDGVI